jgi:alkylation response protein AidB-like acyl-CoA dehydrogenase
LDDWSVAGLAGTGSNSTRVKDAFVPKHRSLSIPDALDGVAPGRSLHNGPLFRTPYYAFLNLCLGGLVPGVAYSALDGFMGRVEKHLVPPMNLVQSDMIRAHRQVADATAKIEVSELLLKDLCDRIMAAGRGGPDFSPVEKARVRLNTALAARYAYEAVERIFMAAGGAALSLDNPVQRAMRDMHAISAHQFMDVETGLELKGMLQLGKTPFTSMF